MDSTCWIPSKQLGWDIGKILQDKGDGNLVIENGTGETITLQKVDTHQVDPTHFEDLEDLCSMNNLHEAPLLNCLKRRFLADKIYTTTGDVLISINPYKSIPGMYNSIVNYLDVPEDGEVDKTASSPHVYKIANLALVEMMHGTKASDASGPRNQSIIVSGESGAGKTEASKHVMNFLIAADQEIKPVSSSNTQRIGLGDTIRSVLVDSSVIFEAFGNAKTVRNDNSSRFGKYIKLQYSSEDFIISAFTETFLLEKSRLMNIGSNERNYHVFYQFLRGNKNPALAEKLHLGAPEQFKMLLDSNGVALPSHEDIQYDNLLGALKTLGCSEEEVENIWTLIASLLHMGNLSCTTITERSEVEVPEGEETFIELGDMRITSSTISISELTALLGVSNQLFLSRLTTQRVKVSSRRSVTVKKLNQLDVINNIAALIKWIYSTLFSWLVKKINNAHCSVSKDDSKAVKFIGILDIFGFEILQTNSFEQLCINFTNERLQQQFNEFVFDREQDIYRTEGLDWNSIAYKDNQHVIDLVGKKPTGLLYILEQQGMLNRGGSDAGALVSAFNAAHDKKSVAYEKSRFGTDGKFTVKHFAGDVTYIVTGFLEKNNDSLQEDLMELMICSSNKFIQNAIVAMAQGSEGTAGDIGYVPPINPEKVVKSISDSTEPQAATATATSAVGTSSTGIKKPEGGGKKLATSMTVSFQFRSQLDILLQTLRATSPHYIKCIKPNTMKIPGEFDGNMVLEQLRYSGALEVVRIRQEGFPIWLSFHSFYGFFDSFSFNRGWKTVSSSSNEDVREYTIQICSEYLVLKTEYQIGLSKVFLRTEAYEKLQLAVGEFLSTKVVKFQTFIRKYFARRRFLRCIRLAMKVQSVIRRFIHRSKFLRLLAAVRAERERIRLEEEARRKAEEEERLRRLEEERKRLEEEERQRRKREEEEKLRVAMEEAKRLEDSVAAKKLEDLRKAEEIRLQLEALQLEEEKKQAELKREEEARKAEEIRQAAEIARRIAEEERQLKENEEAERNAKLEAEKKLQGIELHKACREGNLAVVEQILTQSPLLYDERDASYHNCTVFQSALLSGNVDLIHYFSPNNLDVYSKDTAGNAAINYVAQSMKKSMLDMLRYFVLWSEKNSPHSVLSGGSRTSLPSNSETFQKHKALLNKQNATSGKIHEVVSSHERDELDATTGVLRSGWLSKRGESHIWRKRWVVLTTEGLMYFRNAQDKIPRDTLSFATKNDLLIERSPQKATAIDIYVLNQQSVQKEKDVIEFP